MSEPIEYTDFVPRWARRIAEIEDFPDDAPNIGTDLSGDDPDAQGVSESEPKPDWFFDGMARTAHEVLCDRLHSYFSFDHKPPEVRAAWHEAMRAAWEYATDKPREKTS